MRRIFADCSQATGALEVEFQDVDANELTVTENKTPAAPPTGFKAIDPSSYKIALAQGADGLTLQKVDYIFDITSMFSPFDFTHKVTQQDPPTKWF